MRSPSRFWLIMMCLLLRAAPLAAEEAVAISTVTFNAYGREKLADQAFKPEYFVFGEGGCVSRTVSDPEMEHLNFSQVARVVAAPLAQQNYLPAPAGKQPQLLIIVFWGITQGSRGHDSSLALDRTATALADYSRVKPTDPTAAVDQNSAEGSAMLAALWQMQLANGDRDSLDARNARILGYTDALQRANFTQHMSMGQDVLQELGENRYFVVLQAYDFATAKQWKKLKPLWTTRLSVSEHGKFTDALGKMVWSASRHFGRDTDGLHRQRVKEGTVDLGPLKVIEVVP